jgi:regulator of protease activity HflC (stomatin/prohibitin superfamily)
MRTHGYFARISPSAVALTALLALTGAAGCQSAAIAPGHRGILFDPDQGGVQHEVLQPGFVSLACGPFTRESKCPRLDDFDVTYSTRREDIRTISQEGLVLNLKISIVFRPIIAELYQLDTEIGADYYDEVIAPEFKSACRGIFSHHSYAELQKKNEKIENEIEALVRQRTTGKHLEISSVVIEAFGYDPEVAAQIRSKIIAEQEASRRKAATENEAAQRKRELELADDNERLRIDTESKRQQMEIEAATTMEKKKLEAAADEKKLQIALQTEEETARLQSALRTKENERQLAEQQAIIDKVRTDAELAQARGSAAARIALAGATGEEKKAEAESVTPMQVQMHAYDALAHMGGTGTTIMLGDFAHLPNFLFPHVPAFQSAFTLPFTPYVGPIGSPPVGPTIGGAP